MIHPFLRSALAALLLAAAFPAQATFIDHGNGTVTDTVTGLMWDRCSWGQTLGYSDCTGSVSGYPWAQALGIAVTANSISHRGYTDWRLPNVNELESLVDLFFASPAIDRTAFPNTPTGAHWSSTTLHIPNNSNGDAWCVDFSYGNPYADSQSSYYHVRLVRSGQSFASFDPLSPYPFTFTDQTNVPLSSQRISNTITVAGINAAAAIKIIGGEYRIGSGNWMSSASTVNNGDTVTVRHTSSASFSTTVKTTLIIGDASGTFSSITQAADATPNPFAFIDQTSVPRSSERTSNTITVTGINTAAAISISGGEYRIGGNGNWTSSAGTVNSGGTVTVRHTSSASFASTVNTVLTIGGVSDTFSSTTLATDTTPEPFAFIDQISVPRSSERTSNTITVTGINTAAAISISGGEYRIASNGNWTSSAGTVNSGYTVTVRHTSSASFASTVNTVLTIGGVSDTFSSTTLAADTTPDPFAFADQTGVARSSERTSNPITVAGINGAAATSISGGEYRIGSGSWTSVPGVVNNGDTVTVRHTSSASFSGTVDTVLTIGGVSDTFSSTTLAADTTPDPFAFADHIYVARSSERISNTITVAGINAAAAISISGGEYRIGNANWTSVPGTVNNGERVTVRHTSSSSFSGTVDTVLTIGGVSDTFRSETEAEDSMPDPFAFAPLNGQFPAALAASDPVTISGINTRVSIRVSGGSYAIDDGAFTSAVGILVNGQRVRAQVRAASAYKGMATATVTIGSGSGNFTVTTHDGANPLPFTFTTVRNAVPGSLVSSNVVTLTGFTGSKVVSVSGGEVSVNGGAWGSGSNISEGGTVQVRTIAASAKGGSVQAVVTVGGTSGRFAVITRGGGGLGGIMQLLLD